MTDDDMQNYGSMAEAAALHATGSIGAGDGEAQAPAAAAGDSSGAQFGLAPPQPSGTFAFLDDLLGPLHGWSGQDDQQRAAGGSGHVVDLASHQSSLPHLRTTSQQQAAARCVRVQTASGALPAVTIRCLRQEVRCERKDS